MGVVVGGDVVAVVDGDDPKLVTYDTSRRLFLTTMLPMPIKMASSKRSRATYFMVVMCAYCSKSWLEPSLAYHCEEAYSVPVEGCNAYKYLQ